MCFKPRRGHVADKAQQDDQNRAEPNANPFPHNSISRRACGLYRTGDGETTNTVKKSVFGPSTIWSFKRAAALGRKVEELFTLEI
jgi:hypothetical protein